MFKRLWTWFIGLTAKKRALILAGLVALVIASSATDTSVESNVNEVTSSPTSTASPDPTISETPEASPTASATPTPETPLEFRFSALRDLDDLRKDVKDARSGISQEGLGKFYWNMVEIQFNLSQLEGLLPREEYAEKWNSKLLLLSQAVEAIDTDDENLTISSAKSKLDKILQAIPPLEKIAKSLANQKVNGPKVKRNILGAILLSTAVAISFLPAPAAFAAPQTFSGTTDDIIDISPITAPSIITLTYEGEGVFSASPVDSTGKEGFSYQLDIGSFTGTYFQAKPSKPIVAIAIKGTGEWTVTIDALKTAQKVSAKSGSGSFDTVINLGKPTTGIKRITLSHVGEGVFSVTPIDAKGKSRFPLMLKIGDYKGTVSLPAGTQYLEIKAGADWTYSIRQFSHDWENSSISVGIFHFETDTVTPCAG